MKYLLNASHPGGGAKAHFLEALGFSAQNWPLLRDAIVAHASANDVTRSLRSHFGTKYEIDGPLQTPKVVLRSSVWYGSWSLRKTSHAW